MQVDVFGPFPKVVITFLGFADRKIHLCGLTYYASSESNCYTNVTYFLPKRRLLFGVKFENT